MSSAEAVSTPPSSDLSASEYQYNYTYVAPLAMAQSVPSSQKPTLVWYGQSVWQILRIAHNTLKWKREEAQRKQAQSNPSTPAPAPAPDEMSVDLTHLGLGTLDLTHMDKLPQPGAEEKGLFGELAQLGEAAKLAGQCALLAERSFKQELGGLMDILKSVVGAIRDKPTGRPGSMQDYFNLFTTLPLPTAARSFEQDATFAWMRVAGFNPLVVRRARASEDTLGLNDAQLSAVLGTGDTVQQALSEGRLYLADYKALAGVINGNFPDGPKYMFAPRALFGLPRGSGPRQLRPLGIRCGQDSSGHPLYTPADGEAWLQAKTAVSTADVTYHEMISHLGHTHLLVEPFVIATHRRLPDDHPVSVLLRPHFEGTLFINNEAQASLIAPGGDVDMLLGGTIQASRAVTVASLLNDPDFDFTQGMLPRELERRGVMDPSLDYPYRDDALLVWGAIEKWVRAYVGIYYDSDAAVQADAALQAWSAELVSQEGGRVKGFGEDGVAGKLTTVAYLVQAITMLLFTGSAQHAAVNFAQAGVMTFVPLAPGAAYRAAPSSRADASLNPGLDFFPPLDMAAQQLDFLTLLGSLHHTKLGDYPLLWFKDLRVHAALKQFQEELARIGDTIQQRNTSRYEPYPYLVPSAIPQSINI
ncbi:lipoxygenase family protein [Archangium lansingense]|uniref:lipoxygenase family protein n=1 Tax=Archangium lansingense TaxID=2995310 RepID=UPI003B8009CA